MKTARTFFLLFSLVGFAFSLVIHLLALTDRVPSSESWFVVPFLGALASFVSAGYLSGAKAGRMGLPISEIVRGCPTWLRRTEYFFSAYLALVMVWLVSKSLGLFHWEKVEVPVTTAFVVFSAAAMSFYVSSFSMLFGKMFGENHEDTTSSTVTKETT
jgi:hypothetical protein